MTIPVDRNDNSIPALVPPQPNVEEENPWLNSPVAELYAHIQGIQEAALSISLAQQEQLQEVVAMVLFIQNLLAYLPVVPQEP